MHSCNRFLSNVLLNKCRFKWKSQSIERVYSTLSPFSKLISQLAWHLVFVNESVLFKIIHTCVAYIHGTIWWFGPKRIVSLAGRCSVQFQLVFLCKIFKMLNIPLVYISNKFTFDPFIVLTREPQLLLPSHFICIMYNYTYKKDSYLQETMVKFIHLDSLF